MRIRFVIFVIICTLLFAAIYSSSVPIVYAWFVCSTTGDGKTNFCTDPGTGDFVRCDQNDEGKWICKYISVAPSTDLPTGLKNALDAAIGESKNATKVPKGSFLDDGGLLKGQDNNQTTSKALGDRFCVEGTGGETGNKCIPCDPGLKFLIGCIDVTTGGPLDMPDAATSESGESDDTNPKDLDGSNNDDNGPEVNPGE